MAVFNNNLLAGAGAQSSDSTYRISQSIRFNDDDSAYMSRTPSSAGNRRTWTWSGWVKRGDMSTYSAGRVLLHHGAGGLQEVIRIDSAATNQYLMYYSDPDSGYVRTNATVNDVSAWYHLIFVKDTTQAVSSERIRIYINGTRQTSLQNSTYPSQNSQGYINNTLLHRIGADQSGTSLYDGYLAEVHFLDGYAYGPEYFGETNDNGIWVPKEYDGSYGTNGFKIDGRDSSDLGDDESGQGNDYTTNGLAAHDQVTDTPTNNFPTFNPIYADVSGINSITVANGNLQGTGTSGQFDHKTATFNLPQSGKWYFEYYLGGLYTGFGICIVGQEASITGGYGFGALSTSQGFGYQNDSIYNGNAVTTALGLGNRSAGDILNVAVDVDNDKFYLGINNTYVAADGGSDGNPSSGTNPTVTTSFSLSTNDIILGFYLSSSSGSVYLNFGQDGTFAGNKTAGGNSDASGIGNFLYSVPTGFKALCSKNLGS